MGKRKVVVYVLLTFDFEEWEGKGVVYQADLDGKTRRVIGVLKDWEVPATFFLDADTAKKYPETTVLLRKEAFELALHSDCHFGTSNSHSRILDFSVQDSETQVARMKKAITTIREVIPKFDPKGFRAPGLRWNEALYVSLKKLDFLYDSSQENKFAFQPFLKNGVVVFPVNCGDTDSLCYKYGTNGVVNVWKDRFEKACQFAAETGKSYFVLLTHPAVIGRSKYIGAMKNVLQWMKYIVQKADVHLEFKTCRTAAMRYLNDIRLQDNMPLTDLASGSVIVHAKPTGQRMTSEVIRRPISLAELLPRVEKPVRKD